MAKELTKAELAEAQNKLLQSEAQECLRLLNETKAKINAMGFDIEPSLSIIGGKMKSEILIVKI